MYTDTVGQFPDAYYTQANKSFPNDMNHAFDWCKYIFLANGILRAATTRTVAYFITDIVYSDNTENSDKLKEVFNSLNVKQLLLNAGVNYAVYGNAMSLVYFPFIRILTCTECGLQQLSHLVPFKYEKKQFKGNCKCGANGVVFTVNEKKRMVPEEINIINIEPQSLEIKTHPLSKKCEYYWKIPKFYTNKVLIEKDNFFINDTPSELLEAMSEEKSFHFTAKYIHHIKGVSLSGISDKWATPPFIHVLMENHREAVLKKANEVIALDFIIPFRALSPGASSPNADPVASYHLGDFVSKMREMIKRHRSDPADIQITPFPIQYQAFGAEKKALDVSGEIKHSTESMLHTLNYPAELFFLTLQVQAMPSALRLYENTWQPLVDGLNSKLQWMADHICDFMGWKRECVKLARVTTADDMEKRQIGLQLAAAQQISAITAQRAYGFDFEEEQRKILEQQKITMEIQEQFQQEQQMQQQVSEQEQGGTNPLDINTKAQELAKRWLSMQYEHRRREMAQLEGINPTLYALAKTIMEKMRTASKSEQGMANLQSMGMGGDQAPH